MKVAGIIAEYNPFHAGHKYHIEKTREITGADYIIAVMSGDFVQRGEPAIADKYLRTKLALSKGVDLVVELPTRYSTASAKEFAFGAITLLNNLNSVDFLSFGSECGNLEVLKSYVSILNNEPAKFKELMLENLKKGLSYPLARTNALSLYLNDSNSINITSLPNNILGIEYMCALSALNSPIMPVTIQRTGASYNDQSINSSFPSALSIRNELINNYYNGLDDSDFESNYNKLYPIFENDFSLLLKYKLLSELNSGFTDYLDVSKELSDRICNNVYNFTTFESFCKLLKHKQYTYTRIRRCLLHILLNIKADMANSSTNLPYCRILGLKKSSSKLVSYIKNNTSIPVITKPKEADSMLSSDAMSLFSETAFASELYHSVIYNKYGGPTYNEYKQTPVIIED